MPEDAAAPQAPLGFSALKLALAAHPEFLKMLVSRLSSADHALCANSLQLINSLMRDAITDESDAEWPNFVRRLQDLGVIKAVYVGDLIFVYSKKIFIPHFSVSPFLYPFICLLSYITINCRANHLW